MELEDVGAGEAPCVGPPPILNIYHARVSGLSAAQMKRVSMLRNRIETEQSKLLRIKDAKLKASNAQTQKAQKQQQKPPQQKKEQTERVQTEGQQQKQQQQQQHVQLASPLTGFEIHWADDRQNLARMLIAREWHVPRAFALVMEAIAIRRQLRPERIKPQEVKDAARSGQIYRRGFDKQGRPLIYLRPALNEEEIDGNTSINLLIYTLERACQSQNRHVGVPVGLCFLINYSGYSNNNQPSLGTALRFIQIFQCIYAEQLVAAYLVDTPWYFSTFWNCISPFLPARTAAKIKFLSTSEPADVEQIFDAIDPKYVEPWIPGGKATRKYEHELYWAEEAKQFETYMKFLQNEFFKKTPEQRRAEDTAFSAALAQGLPVEEAMRVAQSALAEKRPSGPQDDSAATETPDGGEDADDTDDPETPESLEDEHKRRMLQEALEKEQQQRIATGSPEKHGQPPCEREKV